MAVRLIRNEVETKTNTNTTDPMAKIVDRQVGSKKASYSFDPATGDFVIKGNLYEVFGEPNEKGNISLTGFGRPQKIANSGGVMCNFNCWISEENLEKLEEKLEALG